LPRGKTASVTFKKPGVFKYILEIPDKRIQGYPGGYSGTIMAEGLIEVK
jgi:hypothetical protein